MGRGVCKSYLAHYDAFTCRTHKKGQLNVYKRRPSQVPRRTADFTFSSSWSQRLSFKKSWIICKLDLSDDMLPGGRTGRWLRYYCRNQGAWVYPAPYRRSISNGISPNGSPMYLAIPFPGSCTAKL